MLHRQNDKMRTRLASLGFAMALEPIPNLKGFDLDLMNDEGGINGDYYGTSGTTLRTKTTSSHTAGRSARTSGEVETAPSSPFMQRPLKRQRHDSPRPNHTQIEPPNSRDAMPPPQKPMSRIRSVRNKIIPTLRKKFGSGRSTQAPEYISHSRDDAHMNDDGRWLDTRSGSARDGRGQDRHDKYRDETTYMTGALPIGHASYNESSRGSQMLSSIGADDDGHDFTFRAPSPVKTNQGRHGHRPVQLPTEPSYMRLMDGLAGDVDVELGLKDPRNNISSYDHGQHRYEDTDQENRRPDLPFQQQVSHRQYPQDGDCPGEVLIDRPDRSYHRTFQELTRNPITPAPQRFQQTVHQIESVVSPYVERYNRNTTHFSQPRIAETQDSSNRFVAYRSQNPQMIATEPDWREPRGVNGLSFFESPVISGSHQHSQHRPERQHINRPPLSRQYQSRNLTSRGLITRPGAVQSPFFRESAYGSSRDRPTYDRQPHVQSNAAVPFPSFNRSSYTRMSQVPSSMPSIVIGRSPVRTQPQWSALQRMGVRSSRHQSSKNVGQGYADQTRNLFSSAGRRSVRR
jgi:hypothetical protein